MTPISDDDVRRLLPIVHGAAAQLVEGDLEAADLLVEDLVDDVLIGLAVGARCASSQLRQVVADVPVEGRPELIVDLTVGAELLGSCDEALIGFAGVLVDAVTRHDEQLFAQAFVAAAAHHPPKELGRGVLAMLASTIVERAARQGLAPGRLAADLCWAAAANDAATTFSVS